MGFGINLGPFRVGTGRGGTYGGVRVGPLSVSGRLGGGKGRTPQDPPPPVTHEPIDVVIADAERKGWRLVRRGDSYVRMECGLHSLVLLPTPAGGTQMRVGLNTRGGLLVTVAVVAGILLVCLACGLLAN